MKILRAFGILIGIHAFALLLLFTNPGCSTKSQSKPIASDPVEPAEPSPMITVPTSGGDSPIAAAPVDGDTASSVAGIAFDPNLVAGADSTRFSPTRPGTTAATALRAAPVSGVTPATTTTVGKGDSLWSIAKTHGISVSDLAAANNLRVSASLRLGQKLIVPAKSAAQVHEEPAAPVAATPATAPAAQPKSGREGTRHTVRPGESLGSIARLYGVKAGALGAANNIADPRKLRAGQELIIPTTAEKAADPQPRPASRTPASAPVSEPAPQAPMPTIDPGSPAGPSSTVPTQDQDLDAGLPLDSAGAVPVIRVEDSPITTVGK